MHALEKDKKNRETDLKTQILKGESNPFRDKLVFWDFPAKKQYFVIDHKIQILLNFI